MVAAALLATCFHPVSAQDDESGVDDDSYLGPNHGWSVEWDEDIWEVAEENNTGGADFLILKTHDDEDLPLAYTRFYGVEGLYDDPDECAENWDNDIAGREGNSDVEETDEYDVPGAPSGGASATYLYEFKDTDARR